MNRERQQERVAVLDEVAELLRAKQTEWLSFGVVASVLDELLIEVESRRDLATRMLDQLAPLVCTCGADPKVPDRRIPGKHSEECPIKLFSVED